MSIAWDTYRRRATALRRVIADLDRSGSPTLPWNDELAAIFDDPDDLLVALHDVWTRRLEGRVDLALEIDEQESVESVALAWREVAGSSPVYVVCSTSRQTTRCCGTLSATSTACWPSPPVEPRSATRSHAAPRRERGWWRDSVTRTDRRSRTPD